MRTVALSIYATGNGILKLPIGAPVRSQDLDIVTPLMNIIVLTGDVRLLQWPEYLVGRISISVLLGNRTGATNQDMPKVVMCGKEETVHL